MYDMWTMINQFFNIESIDSRVLFISIRDVVNCSNVPFDERWILAGSGSPTFAHWGCVLLCVFFCSSENLDDEINWMRKFYWIVNMC